jgi:hypothetical protein
MTRPHTKLGGDLGEQPGCLAVSRHAVARHLDEGVAELAMARAAHFSAQHVGHQLHAVADTQHRKAKLEETPVAPRRGIVRHAARAAGQNHSDRILGANRLNGRAEGDDLGIHGQLTQTTSDELRVLRPEVENENGLV